MPNFNTAGNPLVNLPPSHIPGQGFQNSSVNVPDRSSGFPPAQEGSLAAFLSSRVIPVPQNPLPPAITPTQDRFAHSVVERYTSPQSNCVNLPPTSDPTYDRCKVLEYFLDQGNLNSALGVIKTIGSDVAVADVLRDLALSGRQKDVINLLEVIKLWRGQGTGGSNPLAPFLNQSSKPEEVPLLLQVTHSEVFQALVAYGADTRCLSGPAFHKILRRCLAAGNLPMLSKLIAMKRGFLSQLESNKSPQDIEHFLWHSTDEKGYTLLGCALRYHPFKVTGYLLKLGASSEGLVTSTTTALQVARLAERKWRVRASDSETHKLCQRLVQFFSEQDRGWSQEYQQRKLLSHFFSISGQTQIGKYSFTRTGMPPGLVLEEVVSKAKASYDALAFQPWNSENEAWVLLCHNLTKSEQTRLLTKEAEIRTVISQVPRLMENSLDLPKDAQWIKQVPLGSPTALLGGWQGHTVCGVMTPTMVKGRKVFEILFCNKGEYSRNWGRQESGIQRMLTDENGALEIIGNWNNQVKCISDRLVKEERELDELIGIESGALSDAALAQKALRQQGIMVSWASHLQNMSPPCDIHFDAQALIKQKPQKVGNCSWASLLSMEMAINYTLLRPILDDPMHPELSKKVAKIIKGIRRERQKAVTVLEYVSSHRPRLDGQARQPVDLQLLEEIIRAKRYPKLEGAQSQQAREAAANLLQFEKTFAPAPTPHGNAPNPGKA